jgi:hydroxymethylbilane synthase
MDLRIGFLNGDLGETQARALVTQLGKLLKDDNVTAVGIEPSESATYAEGVFASPLDVSLLNTEVEAYICSLQDVPILLPEGLILAAATQRVDVREAAVTTNGLPLRAMPEGTQVVVDGPRRAHQVRALRGDLEPIVMSLRPEKVMAAIEAGDDQAGIFAMSDLQWMRKDSRAAEILSTDEMLPGAGQGALGLVVREIDVNVAKALKSVNHKATFACVNVERALLAAIGWSSGVPVGALAEPAEGDAVNVRASAFAADGTAATAEGAGSAADPEALGKTVAADLMGAGGERIVRDSRQTTY